MPEMAVPWRGGSDELICVDVQDEAPDVRTFWFAAASDADFAFRAGQFVALALPTRAGPLWRCFTIASPPTRPRRIALTVKRQPDGQATRWMHEELQPGMRLRGQPPAGRFALDAPPARKLVLIAAGSGATPMIAIARWLQDLRSHSPVHYLHVARHAADHLFHAEVTRIAGDLGGWRHDWLSTGATGRPSAAVLRTRVPDLGNAVVFCCGPAAFMAMARTAFDQAGGSPADWHEESFAIGATGATAEPEPPATASGFAIRFEPAGVTAMAGPGETLLAVATRARQTILHACRQGICGSCRIHKISGEVEMTQQGGITATEIAAGDILACCSRARSPLVLELP
ncbi:MAG: iron-sulfur cluster-binding domain-containing protein [Azospirillaceae bacterium]|nr:iron-sulfur cluster-binding domain-containing protein [Azospirillaceae bacterium]